MPVPDLIDLNPLAQLHAAWTADWHHCPYGTPSQQGLWAAIELNHHFNFSLWHEEDIARVDAGGADRIRLAKRNIDAFNQQRNDAMELIDDYILSMLEPVGMNQATPMHTETPGMIIDRLSIMSLKRYHMAEEADRQTATPEHREKCAARVQILEQQLADLNLALQGLLREVLAGTRHFRKYRQLKMYNDPQLNPQLYAQQQPTAAIA